MKSTTSLLSLAPLFLGTGCAGPIGPPLGLGPVGDELAIIVVLGLIATLAYRPIRKFFLTYGQATNASLPLDIIKERYARGEISQDEFERMKQHLS
jgi:uncharacterized membrane protein